MWGFVAALRTLAITKLVSSQNGALAKYIMGLLQMGFEVIMRVL